MNRHNIPVASRKHAGNRLLTCCLAVWLSCFSGCAAFRPVRGVPASYVSEEYLSTPREGRRQLDLSLLQRTPPDQHRVAGGDILSIYIPRVLGNVSTELNEVGISPPINLPASPDDPPTVGYPIQVRDDHTISLPQIPPLNVHGMTLYEVEQAIRRAYTVERQILQPEQAMILVSLFRPREHRVLIFRQEFGQEITPQTGAGSVNFGRSKKGTARQVRLKEGENDVAHALTLAGVDGLPGNEAENVIYIIRGPRQRQVAGGAQSAGSAAQQWTAPSGPISHSPLLLTPQPVPASSMHPAPAGSSPFWPAVQSQPLSYPVQRMSHESDSSSAAPHGVQYADYAQPVTQTGPEVVLIDYTYASRPANVGTVPVNGWARSGETASQHPSASGWPTAPAVLNPATGAAYPSAAQPAPADQVVPGVQPAAFVPTNSVGGFAPGYPSMASSHSTSFPAELTQGWGQSLPVQPIPPTGVVPQPLIPAAESPELHWSHTLANFDPTIDNPNIVKIPIRLFPGETPHFSEGDITLYDGDMVFIESRETEVFYTGGLLGGGQYPIPRDYDLHVLEAVSIAESRNMQGGGATRSIGGVSSLNQDVANSASRLLILRKLPNGPRARIEVDLYKALVRDEENILVRPGDMLVLQYTFPEACAAFTQRFLLEGALIGVATSTFTGGR